MYFLLSVICLLINTVLSTQCLVCEDDACGSLAGESQCKGNTNCSYLRGCCQTDLCNAVTNALFDVLPSEASALGLGKAFICGQGGLSDYCSFKDDRCVLKDCYQRKEYTSSSCPSDTCELGNCPIGKIFPDGSKCCNPKGLNIPDCYGDGSKTWQTCTDSGCSFYSGNCYPDLCAIIPRNISFNGVPLLPVDPAMVEGFCLLDNDKFKQHPCYSYPPNECYNHDECFFANGECPFDMLTGQSSPGCCAPITDEFQDSSECAKRGSESCADAEQICVWRTGLSKCAINPVTASPPQDDPTCTMKEVMEPKDEPKVESDDAAIMLQPWSVLPALLFIMVLIFG